MNAMEGLHPPARGGWLRRFVDAWCQISAMERGGRLYERLGLLSVFRLVASVFGERLPPPTWQAAPVGGHPDEWLRGFARTRYHELLNLIALLVYTPLFVWLCLHARWGLAVYCGVLMMTHKAALMLERYKRARFDALLTAAGVMGRSLAFEALWKPQEAVLPPILASAPARRYFAPKRFETEGLYRRLGIGAFRAFVLALFRATATEAASDAAVERFLTSRSDVLAFERQTRIAEATHLVGMVQHVPFAVGMILARDWAGGLYVAGMLAVNLVCVLLQRWHRLRIQPIVQRLAEREAADL